MNINNFLEKIKSEKPKPKIVFIIKKIALWFLFSIFMIIGILSVSLIIFSVFGDNEINQLNLSNKILSFLYYIPYLWIIINSIFFIVAYINIKNIDNSYKYLNFKNISLSILLTIFLGVIFYNTGFAKFVDENIQKNITFYREYRGHMNHQRWNNPESGLIIGDIKKINGNELEIFDYNNKNWLIYVNQETIIKDSVIMSVDQRIKIIGEIIEENKFKAKEIRPGIGKGMRNNK